MKTNTRFIIFVLLCILSTSCLSYGEDYLQKTDAKKSKIEVSLSSPIMQLEGSPIKFSGALKSSGSEFETSQIEFKLDISAVKVKQANDMGLMFLELIKKLPEPLLVFKSTRIYRIKGTEYLIEGELTRGNVKHKVKTFVTLISFTKKQTVVKVSRQGKIKALPPELSLPFLDSTSMNGKVLADIVFTK